MKFPSYNLETIVLSSIFIFFATIIFAHFFGQFLHTYMNVIPPRHRQLEGMTSISEYTENHDCPSCSKKSQENKENKEGMGCSKKSQ